MRYTTEFKLMCVELYRQGKWVKTPKGIKTANFRNKIRTWNRIEQAGGPGALCHKAHYKAWSPEEKLELVSQVNAGQSMMAVACQMETFFGRMKNEMYYGSEKEYTSFKVFAKAVKEYIHYFNKERIQKKTKWMPPEIYRETSTNAI